MRKIKNTFLTNPKRVLAIPKIMCASMCINLSKGKFLTRRAFKLRNVLIHIYLLEYVFMCAG